MSFVCFHERGFGTPPDRFIRELLHHYGLELQNLNPNSVSQIAIFIGVCEGYKSMRLNFVLWKYYFSASVFWKMLRSGGMTPVQIDSCSF